MSLPTTSTLPTLGVLENFLSEYPGCLLIVSHDRYFMDRLVDHLFVFEGDGAIRDFPGNYSQYRLWLKDEREEDKADSKTRKQEEKRHRLRKLRKRKLSYNEKREFEQLQKDIAKLEKEKQTITEQMNSGSAALRSISTVLHTYK